jgi:hypothetical protein
MELMREDAAITVSLVKPAAVDSPYSRHARNLTGYATQNPQPVYATHVVADTILYCASHPIREITVGGGGRLIASFYSVLPGLAEPLFARFAPSLMRDRSSAYEPYDDGLYDPSEDGLAEEVHYPMVRQFSALAEVRKHPGVASGVLAVLAGVGIAALLLNQRSGPTRYERIRGRLNPRGWVDTGGLRDRFGDLAETVRHSLSEAGERAPPIWARDARHRGERILHGARHSSRKALKKHGKTARRYAHDAGDYARDHAKEGGALLAVCDHRRGHRRGGAGRPPPRQPHPQPRQVLGPDHSFIAAGAKVGQGRGMADATTYVFDFDSTLVRIETLEVLADIAPGRRARRGGDPRGGRRPDRSGHGRGPALWRGVAPPPRSSAADPRPRR